LFTRKKAQEVAKKRAFGCHDAYASQLRDANRDCFANQWPKNNSHFNRFIVSKEVRRDSGGATTPFASHSKTRFALFEDIVSDNQGGARFCCAHIVDSHNQYYGTHCGPKRRALLQDLSCRQTTNWRAISGNRTSLDRRVASGGGIASSVLFLLCSLGGHGRANISALASSRALRAE
jgi:hypothetical protein